jgi:hypothetical protein
MKTDLDLRSLLIFVVYTKRIQDPIPYPTITVKTNIIVSEVVLYGKS